MSGAALYLGGQELKDSTMDSGVCDLQWKGRHVSTKQGAHHGLQASEAAVGGPPAPLKGLPDFCFRISLVGAKERHGVT